MRFIDDPSNSDTGTKSSSVIDMGASESKAASPCPADLTVDGQYNLFDVSTFHSLFSAGCP